MNPATSALPVPAGRRGLAGARNGNPSDGKGSPE